MNEPLASLVHQTLNYGLVLRRRIAQGKRPNLSAEQAVLKDMLLAANAADERREFGADAAAPGAAAARPGDAPRFLGIRYLLVCWLDELFTDDSEWGRAWNERKLEMELYGSNDRAWRFWEQARLAQNRVGADALEACYLCVALGFQGQLAGDPDKLEAWTASVKRQLGVVREPQWPLADELVPPCEAQPLLGERRLERMVLTGWLALLTAIPLVTFVVFRRFSG
jgi:type VI secretion system protein ImpK